MEEWEEGVGAGKKKAREKRKAGKRIISIHTLQCLLGMTEHL